MRVLTMVDHLRLYEYLENTLYNCSKCPKMVQSRKEVMGEDHYPCSFSGNLNSKFMFIGIAPGRMSKDQKDETQKDSAFKYGSGKVLKRLLNNFNISEDEVFITNVVKCNTPADNEFLDEDVERCTKKFLIREIKLINPKKIFLLGRKAQQYFNVYVKNQIRNNSYYLYHPSAILRGFLTYESLCNQFRRAIND